MGKARALAARVEQARREAGPPPTQGPIRTEAGWYGAMLRELALALAERPDLPALPAGYTGEMVYARYGGDRAAFEVARRRFIAEFGGE